MLSTVQREEPEIIKSIINDDNIMHESKYFLAINVLEYFLELFNEWNQQMKYSEQIK